MEKVIKGLELCGYQEGMPQCDSCPYDGKQCWKRLKTDAIALLKTQEPVKPYAVYSEHTGTKWLVCGACDEPMNKVRDETWSNYCPNCGRAVKWE
jgi:hypothetical protein